MTLNEITERVMALSPEQVRHETATGPMGAVEVRRGFGVIWYEFSDGISYPRRAWRPDEDRNQSRAVTDAVPEDAFWFSDAHWLDITPLDECRAALIAWEWAKEQEEMTTAPVATPNAKALMDALRDSIEAAKARKP